MEKRANNVSVIGGADGPTSVFVVGRNSKLPLKQRMQRFRYKIKRFYVEKTLKPEYHSLDEVMEYVKGLGFVELDKDSYKVKVEYQEMRASLIMQYAPELLGEYAKVPELKGESPEKIKLHIKKLDERLQKASEVPETVFDIDFHKFEKMVGDRNDHMQITIEKKYAYIGGGASGDKAVKMLEHIYKDVYRYYGVTKQDMENKSKRYKDVVQVLSQ